MPERLTTNPFLLSECICYPEHENELVLGESDVSLSGFHFNRRSRCGQDGSGEARPSGAVGRTGGACSFLIHRGRLGKASPSRSSIESAWPLGGSQKSAVLQEINHWGATETVTC